MYAVTSTPPVRRTRASLRRAELGFLGVVVYTRVHTPRRCGLPLSAGVLVLETLSWRPLRTSWLIVGTDSPYVVNVVCPGHAVATTRTSLWLSCPGPQPRGSGSWTRCSPLHFPAHPQRDDADCPAGGSSLIVARPGPCWSAVRILSGSRARNSPGTVVKVTAWVDSIQICMPPHAGSSARVTGQPRRVDAHAGQPAYRLAGLFRRRRRFDLQGCNKPANGPPTAKRGGPEGPPRRYRCCMAWDQSRSKPRLASSRRIAS